jgi:hypothetical protein
MRHHYLDYTGPYLKVNSVMDLWISLRTNHAELLNIHTEWPFCLHHGLILYRNNHQPGTRSIHLALFLSQTISLLYHISYLHPNPRYAIVIGGIDRLCVFNVVRAVVDTVLQHVNTTTPVMMQIVGCVCACLSYHSTAFERVLVVYVAYALYTARSFLFDRKKLQRVHVGCVTFILAMVMFRSHFKPNMYIHTHAVWHLLAKIPMYIFTHPHVSLADTSMICR